MAFKPERRRADPNKAWTGAERRKGEPNRDPISAAVGAVAGGLAGKGVAEAIDPTAEEAYWRDNYRTRPYYEENLGYDQLAPAYRYGWESHSQFKGRRFDEVESDLERGWDRAKANSSLQWTTAKLATRDAWDRIDRGRRAA